MTSTAVVYLSLFCNVSEKPSPLQTYKSPKQYVLVMLELLASLN